MPHRRHAGGSLALEHAARALAQVGRAQQLARGVQDAFEHGVWVGGRVAEARTEGALCRGCFSTIHAVSMV